MGSLIPDFDHLEEKNQDIENELLDDLFNNNIQEVTKDMDGIV